MCDGCVDWISLKPMRRLNSGCGCTRCAFGNCVQKSRGGRSPPVQTSSQARKAMVSLILSNGEAWFIYHSSSDHALGGDKMFEAPRNKSSNTTVNFPHLGFLILQGRQIRSGRRIMTVMQKRITQTRLWMCWRSICVRQRLSQPLPNPMLHSHPLLDLHL